MRELSFLDLGANDCFEEQGQGRGDLTPFSNILLSPGPCPDQPPMTFDEIAILLMLKLREEFTGLTVTRLA